MVTIIAPSTAIPSASNDITIPGTINPITVNGKDTNERMIPN